MDKKAWFKIGLCGGAAAAAAYVLLKQKRVRQQAGHDLGAGPGALEFPGGEGAPRPAYRMERSPASRAVSATFNVVNHFLPWHRLPPWIGVFNLLAFREELREKNLHDTSILPAVSPPKAEPKGPFVRQMRTIDGSYNDLAVPAMGMVGTRFGRNIPLDQVNREPEPALLQPSPREVSRRLLARDTFVPARSLNLLAAAWIQFQIHDWFSHGSDPGAGEFHIPLADDDPWPEAKLAAARAAGPGRTMDVLRTPPDPTRPPHDSSGPPTFINRVTHWWDASGIYGDDEATIARLRSGEDGKLRTQRRDLPTDPKTGMAISGFTDNWWVGLALLHTLFALEHNAICDRLRLEYPNWPDEQLYCKARLVNCALIAKIHTLEWTPAILAHPALKLAMNTNWWGLAGEALTRLLGRRHNEILTGIPGSGVEHHSAPFALTEEFVSVYRLHALVPDEFDVWSLQSGEKLRHAEFPELLAEKANAVIHEGATIQDVLYSFGTSHPGAITLHNYPRFLRHFEKKDDRGNSRLMDLAAVDILRDRERGVPRYNTFRRLVHKPPVRSFAELTTNCDWARELRDLYEGDLERVDTMVGLYAEPLPRGFGFSDTAFRIFILMASRRLKSDRFFATHFTPEVYTPAGIEWVDNNSLISVLIRHYPELTPALQDVKNGFAPWMPLH